MLNLSEYNRHPRALSDYLPWAALIAPGIILNKDGSFLRCAQYRGPDLDSATPSELIATIARINNVLRRMGAGWTLYFDAIRTPVTHYPGSRFPDEASKRVDQERQLRFLEDSTWFESRYILSFVYLPPADPVQQAADYMFETSSNKRKGYKDHLSTFTTETDRALDLLTSFLPLVQGLNDRDLLTYLHSLISNKTHPVKVPDTPCCLDAIMSDTPLSGGLSPKLGNQHMRTLTVLGFPNNTMPGILDDLNDLALPYRWTTRWIPMDKAQAEKTLKRIRRQWFVKRKSAFVVLQEVLLNRDSPLIDSDAGNKAGDADEALQELGSDDVVYGFITTTLTVKHEDPAQADYLIQQVERCINSRGFVTIRESLNAVEAWLGSLPAHVYANVRRPIVHSVNLAHMMPVSEIWAGSSQNKHLQGPPLLLARTKGATPFRLNLHVGDVGHSLIVGPTGAGKSVLLSLLALQFRRYKDAQIVLFDKGRSARAAVLGMNGKSFDLSLDGQFSLQPLIHCHDQAHKAFAYQWLCDILSLEGLSLDTTGKQLLWSALETLASAPQKERTLTGLSLLVQSDAIRKALHPFTLEGAYGRLLDADQDSLSLASVLHFEMEELLHTPQAVFPVLSYLFYRLQSCFDGRPTLLILDEAWVFLDNPLFSSRIREWLKTLRKKNVAVVFATQSLSDIGQSQIASTLIESCPTRIFLPNDRAQEPQIRSIYEQFGLNDRQISLISQALPKCDYYLQSSVGNRLFELDLGPIALALCGSSRPEDHHLMDQILTRDPDQFLNQFLSAKGLSQ